MPFFFCLLLTLSAHGKDLIPLQDFFKNPVSAAFSISPNGKNIAYLKSWEGRLNIFIRPTDHTGEEKRLSSVKDRDIGTYFWKGDKNILYLRDFGGDENFHLFRIDIAAGTEIDLTPYKDTRVDVIDELEHVNDTEVLISHNQRDPKVFDVYRLNLADNSTRLVFKNPGDIDSYRTDTKGKLLLAIRSVGADSEVLVRASESKNFHPLLKFDFNDSFVPLMFSVDGKSLYVLSNLGRDKLALVEYNLQLKKEVKILYQSTEYDIDTIGVSPLLYSYKQNKILGVNFLTWRLEQAFFDPATESLFKQIQELNPGSYSVLLSQNKAEDKFIFVTSSDRSRGKFYLVDSKSKKVELLANAAPWLNDDKLRTMQPVEFNSRDGLRLHGYLTLPSGISEKNLPVVINPHGGPWGRDIWRFNSETQFLANRGYAVLQVNFRGSTGYGKSFLKSSFKQWGLTMQDDITDATQWLIRQGIANPKKICIYGGSYGGYATLMGLVKEPDLYACGVDYVGVANLFTFMKTIPPYWTTMLEKLRVWVGDPEKDKEQFIATSPAFNVAKIKAPLFIAQGANDPRVNKDESDQMVKNLKARGVEVPYMVKNNEGHGFRNEENRFEFYGEMEKFLGKYLQ